MSKIVPITGRFENVAALLAHVAEHDIESLVMITKSKDGVVSRVHMNTTREEMAMYGAYITQWALDRDA